jgi:hypothetical protein
VRLSAPSLERSRGNRNSVVSGRTPGWASVRERHPNDAVTLVGNRAGREAQEDRSFRDRRAKSRPICRWNAGGITGA